MGLQKYLKELYKKPKKSLGELWRQRLIKWRREPVLMKIDRPTRIDRARALGYKAKQGYVVVRVRVKRGGKKREKPRGGRKPKKSRRKKILAKNYQWIAEERAARRYRNCEVLGSYWIMKDGLHYWYEIILADRVQVSKYKGMEHLGWTRGKVFRGLTSAGRKARS